MRKNEIQPGVVYAFLASKYDLPEPVVFLRPPADGVVYESSSMRRRAALDPYFTPKTTNITKPYSGMFETVGYPAVRLAHWNSDAAPDELLVPTLEQFERVTSNYDIGNDRLRFALVTSLKHIIGEYDSVMAERSAAQG
jgi:hypothetical protein